MSPVLSMSEILNKNEEQQLEIERLQARLDAQHTDHRRLCYALDVAKSTITDLEDRLQRAQGDRDAWEATANHHYEQLHQAATDRAEFEQDRNAWKNTAEHYKALAEDAKRERDRIYSQQADLVNLLLKLMNPE